MGERDSHARAVALEVVGAAFEAAGRRLIELARRDLPGPANLPRPSTDADTRHD